MRILGLGHYSRTGKDTFANNLIAAIRALDPDFKVGKISFAWKMKQMVYELYAWAGVKPPEHYDTEEGAPDRNVKLTKLASHLFPEGPTVVELWIAMGTDAIRDNLYDGTWIDYVLRSDHGLDLLIIPDTRFFNEVAAIKKANGHLIKFARPGIAPRTSRADTELMLFCDWDAQLCVSLDESRWYAKHMAFAYLRCEDNPCEGMGNTVEVSAVESKNLLASPDRDRLFDLISKYSRPHV